MIYCGRPILTARMDAAFQQRHGSVGVTRWNGNIGEGNGGDPRMQSISSLFYSNYAEYVHQTRDPQDLRFVKFLVESGLAAEWGAKEQFVEAISTPRPP